ncbi:hypothetical protein MAR621_00173 [Maribacter dokdonensis]|uniref:TIR domain-containing protein n=1 Tax=Maribacter dokdonensis TaxID=320912 RepID=UPI001B1F35EC|nr:TIR domain-containing protein [Maribacter dokdonensis]CAG2535059.1 hypothetical protein MAR621_00173 [Maribacter dokdonensis]
MKNNFTIFYSWQSDLTGKSNRNLINNCLEKAIKELKKNSQNEFHLEINLDRDTRNKSGSPSISKTIFDKINTSDVFIADVSIINNNLYNKAFKSRLTPNPNVLIELGYAINLLGWERIICVNNLKYGKNEILPFDIRGHRITSYDSQNPQSKKQLQSTLKSAISSIIDEYENIEERHHLTDHNRHDKLIWEKFKAICSETMLHDSISQAVDSLFTTKYYIDKWDNFADFYRTTENHFINRDLDLKIKDFLIEMNRFNSICMSKFFQKKDDAMDEIRAMKSAGIEFTEDIKREYYHSVVYMIKKDPYPQEQWRDADKRNMKTQDLLFEKGQEVKAAYQNLVLEIKKRGLN